MNFKPLAALTLAASAALLAAAGPLANIVCLIGCNALAVSCYAAAGFTFGLTLLAAPPAIVACKVALGRTSTAA